MQVPLGVVTHGLGVTSAPAPVHVKAMTAFAAGDVVVPSVTVALITNSCCVPTGFVADGVIVTEYASHVFVVVSGTTCPAA